MESQKLLITMVIILTFILPLTSACYGKTAEVLQDSSGPLIKIVDAELTDSFGMHEKQNTQTAPLKISPALAHAVAKKFLDNNFQEYENFMFEAFTFEHGKYVYMFDAEIPGINLEVPTGRCGGNEMNAKTNHMHFHVDAVSGDIYGLGCGGGPGKVIMQFNENNYPQDLQTKSMNLSQFKTDFVAKESSLSPKIDGIIEESEWADVKAKDMHFGPNEISIKSKIIGENIYFAIEANTENWIALLLKDNPHHGMMREFKDAKLLQNGNVEDYYLTDKGMMGTPYLTKDSTDNIISESGLTGNGKSSYEFSFPLNSADTEDNSWSYGSANNIMLWVGDTKNYEGNIDPNSWISSQPILWIGEASTENIFEEISFVELSTYTSNSKSQKSSFWSKLMNFFKSI